MKRLAEELFHTTVERCRLWPIVEVVIAGSLIYLVYGPAWLGRSPIKEPSSDQRAISADAVTAALTEPLTVVGIMLAAALVAVERISSLGPNTKTHIRYAIVYSVLSLIFGSIALSYLPAWVGSYDVATVVLIACLGAAQQFLMIAAAARLLIAISSILG